MIRFVHFRKYVRYFMIGFIFTALVFGNVAIQATRPEIPVESCQPYWGGPGCPDGQSPNIAKPICPYIDSTPPCPLDAVA